MGGRRIVERRPDGARRGLDKDAPLDRSLGLGGAIVQGVALEGNLPYERLPRDDWHGMLVPNGMEVPAGAMALTNADPGTSIRNWTASSSVAGVCRLITSTS